MEKLKAWTDPSLISGSIKELLSTSKLASGMVILEVCQLLLQPMAVTFAGRLSTVEMDAVSLANSMINVFGNSIALSAASACDTLFSQLNIGSFLLFIKVDPVVSRLTTLYIQSFTPGLFCIFAFTVIRRYVQVQNAIAVHVYVSVIGISVHAVMQYLWVYYFEMSVIGSSIAQSIAYFSMVACYLFYILFTKRFKDTWTGLDRRCLLGWGPFCKLALYGILMTCTEWWAVEALLILAGVRGVVELGVQSVLLSCIFTFYGFVNGFSLASTIRCGQFLGAGEMKKAQRSLLVGFGATSVLSIILTIFIFFMREYIIGLFTNIPEVLEGTMEIMPLYAIYMLSDLLSSGARRFLSGIGRQSVGFVVVLISFYGVGLPIGIPLWWMTPLALKGLWSAMTAAVYLMMFILYIYIFVIANWEQLTKEAINRSNECKNDKVQLFIKNQRDKFSDEKEEMKPIARKIIESKDISEEKVTTQIILKRIASFVFCLILLAIAICTAILNPLPSSDYYLFVNNTFV